MENKDKKKLIVVAGPTAVGKTSYSISLAKEVNGEIISLDSVQVYKYLNIGSAKISKEEMQGIKHYMIDEVEPSVNLNVKEYKDKVLDYINLIYQKNKIPILVGGTGFYIRAIVYDSNFLYEDDVLVKRIRKKLYEDLENYGIDYIYKELEKVDNISAKNIAKQNEKRIIRALEFYKLHNFPISIHNENERKKTSPYNLKFYVLNRNREELYERINKRVDIMIEKGLLIEVKKLINMGLDKNLNSMKSIGYKELYDFCKERDFINDIKKLKSEDKKKLDDIIELIKKNSRNYAKRQLTWFKKEKDVTWKNF